MTFCHAQDRAGKLAIYNMQGVNVATVDLSTSGTTTLDLDLESGIYIAVAQYADGGCERAKFIKQ
nr:T9SS type A sorting domain-containing protein [Barnesiella sp. An55]